MKYQWFLKEGYLFYEWDVIWTFDKETKYVMRVFPVVKWLRFCIPNAGGPGFDPWSGN